MEIHFSCINPSICSISRGDEFWLIWNNKWQSTAMSPCHIDLLLMQSNRYIMGPKAGWVNSNCSAWYVGFTMSVGFTILQNCCITFIFGRCHHSDVMLYYVMWCCITQNTHSLVLISPDLVGARAASKTSGLITSLSTFRLIQYLSSGRYIAEATQLETRK